MNALIFYQILLTYSFWNRIEISLENLYKNWNFFFCFLAL